MHTLKNDWQRTFLYGKNRWALIGFAVFCLTGFAFQKKETDILDFIGNASLRFLIGTNVPPKVNTLVFNRNKGEVLISFEPVPQGQPNILKFTFENLLKKRKFQLGIFGQLPVRKILFGSGNNFYIFGAMSGKIFVLKNDQVIGDFSVKGEITFMALNKGETLLAVGDNSGKVTVLKISQENLEPIYQTRLLPGKILALEFQNESAFYVAGEGPEIYLVDAEQGRILQTLQTMSSKGALLGTFGINFCSRPRTNKLIYIKKKRVLLTSHGWEYCKERIVRVWGASQGEIIHEFKPFKESVFQMVWIPAIQSVILVDQGDQFWKLSLKDADLAGPIKFKKTFKRVGAPIPSHIKRVGHVNEMVVIPDSPYLLMATGSYFSMGGGVSLIKFTFDSFQNVVHLTFDNQMFDQKKRITEMVMFPYQDQRLFNEFLDYLKGSGL